LGKSQSTATPSLPSQLLIEARKLISDPCHWTQGTLARNRTGEPCQTTDPAAFKWCSLGALTAVEKKLNINIVEHNNPGQKALIGLQHGMPHGVTSYNDSHDFYSVLAAWDVAIAYQLRVEAVERAATERQVKGEE